MKKILLLFAVMISVTAFAQKSTRQSELQQLLEVLQMRSSTQEVVNKLIDLHKKQKPAVPQQVWNDIKNSVDYNAYMTKVADIFRANYTKDELHQLIKSAIAVKPKQPQFKNIVQRQLYDAGKGFGQQLADAIQTQLKSKGF